MSYNAEVVLEIERDNPPPRITEFEDGVVFENYKCGCEIQIFASSTNLFPCDFHLWGERVTDKEPTAK